MFQCLPLFRFILHFINPSWDSLHCLFFVQKQKGNLNVISTYCLVDFCIHLCFVVSKETLKMAASAARNFVCINFVQFCTKL